MGKIKGQDENMGSKGLYKGRSVSEGHNKEDKSEEVVVRENKDGTKMVKGAVIIGAAGVLVKVMGAFFRIPITNWMGADGMAYYAFAYSIYGMLIVIATAGIPVAISRLVSENIALKRYRNADKVFRVSLGLVATLGFVLFAACFFGADILMKMMGNPHAASAVRAIAPALLFVPILASYRGYFQGRQNMKPTAVSQIIEQIVRVAVGLFLTLFLLDRGLVIAAAGASFGATAGSIAGLLTVIIIYILSKPAISYKIANNDPFVQPTSTIAKSITMIALPIILGSMIVPIMNLTDTAIVMRRLQATGFTFEESNHLFGLISSYCSALISFPSTFIQAVSISLVPAIAKAVALEDQFHVRSHIQTAYRLTSFVAFPCAVGLFVLAEPILLLLYPSNPGECAEAAPALMIMSIGIIAVAISETSTGILQSIGKQNVPAFHLLVAALVKIGLTYLLVGINQLNILGAALSSLIAFTVSFLWNDISVISHTGTRIKYFDTYAKPLISSLVMGLSVFLIHMGLDKILPGRIATIIAVVIGAIVYVFMALVTKTVTRKELEYMRAGRKLNALIDKIQKRK